MVMSNGYRTISQHLNDLKKENFSLKLRIYFLEERIQQKFEDSTSEDVHRKVSSPRLAGSGGGEGGGRLQGLKELMVSSKCGICCSSLVALRAVGTCTIHPNIT